MVMFRDIDKSVGDVLRVGFCHDKPWLLAVNRGGDNPKFNATGTLTAANLLDVTPSIRYAYKGIVVDAKAGSTGGASVDLKYEVAKNTSKDVKWDGLSLLKGLTLGTRFERRMPKPALPSDSTDVSAEYKSDVVHGRAHVNPYTMTWGVSSCLTFDKLQTDGTLMFGGELSGGKELSALNYTVGAAYKRACAKPWAISLKAAPHQKVPFGKLTGGIYASTEQGHALAAELQHIVADCSTGVTLGGLVYLSPKKETWVKAKLLPDAQVGTVFCHKFSDNMTGSFGAQFPSTPDSKDQIKYGMKIALTC